MSNEQKHGGAMQESFRASVKPLEWKPDGRNHWFAASSVVQGFEHDDPGYRVGIRGKYEKPYYASSTEDHLGIFMTLPEAKVSCQADHDKRVRALLNIEEPSNA